MLNYEEIEKRVLLGLARRERLRRIKRFIMTSVIIILVIIAIDFFRATDSTDKSRWRRSGLSVYKDNKTGVQYVKGGFFGGTTVRVDRDGKPLIED